MSRALGMEPLQLHCEDHVTSKMSVGNACAFLAAAVRLEDVTGWYRFKRDIVGVQT